MSGNPKGLLVGRAREMISKVDEYFENEKKQALELLKVLDHAKISPGAADVSIPRDEFAQIILNLQRATKVTERVVQATGVNKNTVSRIRRERTEARGKGGVVRPEVYLTSTVEVDD